MDADFVIKSMENFLKFMREKINEMEYIDPLYETFFTVQWMGETAYIPFGASPVNGLREILEEELGLIEVIR